MGEMPIIGSIRATAFTYAEQGWLFCDGSLVPIAQYQALYVLLATTYGGDGRTTFGLPDLRSFAMAGFNPYGANPNGVVIAQGQTVGQATVALNVSQMPAHTHTLMRKSPVDQKTKINTISSNTSLGFLGGAVPNNVPVTIPAFCNEASPNPPLNMDAPFHPASIGPAGSGSAHENRQPFLALNFQICYDGEFPNQ